MEIQYYNKIRWGLAPLAPNDAPPLVLCYKLLLVHRVLTLEQSYSMEGAGGGNIGHKMEQ
jgi:hypothetical protein